MAKKQIENTQSLFFENEHSRSLIRMAMLIESQIQNEKKQKKMSPLARLALDQKINTGIETLWKTIERAFQDKESHILEIKE